jgi:transcriptional regulator of acetoin/glycerol metabolism
LRPGDTLTQADEPLDDEAGARADVLVQALDAARPQRAPLRHSLAGVERVVFKRASEPGARRVVEAGRQTLEIGIDDPRVSSLHARLSRLAGRWIVEDAGSKNGTLLNGATVGNGRVADGDLLELGHTFFLLREDQEVGEGGRETLLPGLARRLDELGRVAASDVPVLVLGESGTGKERVARSVHDGSGRGGAWVAVNCGALPDTLIESELFGCKKGAFSGATQDRIGLVRSADGGTLFLDEIGDLPAPSQAALLRVLQEREVLPVGGDRPVPVDLRVVAATHRDLAALVEAGSFRADLLARLGGFKVALPPLRERREDLGLLIAAIFRRREAASATLTPRAARALFFHDWPLNVRELELCLSSALLLAGDGPIAPAHLPEVVRAREARPAAPAEEALDPADEKLRGELLALLRETGGNLAEVARRMGKARMQIHRWMRRLKLTPDGFR